MKKLFLLLFLIPTLFSCEETIDQRDSYVGNWDVEVIGNMNLIQGSDIVYTIPISISSDMDVSKQSNSENELNIGGLICILSGNRLIFDAETETQSENGTTMQVTVNRSGTINSTLMSIKETYSGTWQTSNQNGIISGSSNYTFTKN